MCNRESMRVLPWLQEGVGEHAWVAEGRRRWAEAGGDASVWVHGSGTLEQARDDGGVYVHKWAWDARVAC